MRSRNTKCMLKILLLLCLLISCSPGNGRRSGEETVGIDDFRIDFSRVSEESANKESPALVVDAFTLVSRIEYETVSALGSLEPIREYAIRMPFGAVATSIHDGAVGIGQTLVTLETKELERELRRLQQELLLKEVGFLAQGGEADQAAADTLLGSYLAESRSLLQEGLSPKADLAALLNRHLALTSKWLKNKELISALRRLETGIYLTFQDIADVSEKIKQARILSPAAGIFYSQDSFAGEYYPSGQLIGRFYPTDTRAAKVEVPDRAILAIRAGMTAEISIGLPEVAAAGGVVSRVSPLKDQDTGTYEVLIELAAVPQSLPFGLPLRAAIRVGTGSAAFLVPFEAVQSEGDRFFLWRIENETLSRVEIGEPRYSAEGYLIDLSDSVLREGSVIAKQYRVSFKEGARVSPR